MISNNTTTFKKPVSSYRKPIKTSYEDEDRQSRKHNRTAGQKVGIAIGSMAAIGVGSNLIVLAAEGPSDNPTY